MPACHSGGVEDRVLGVPCDVGETPRAGDLEFRRKRRDELPGFAGVGGLEDAVLAGDRQVPRVGRIEHWADRAGALVAPRFPRLKIDVRAPGAVGTLATAR